MPGGLTIDNEKEYIYVTAGASAQVSKIGLGDCKVIWTAPTGMFGRTLSMINASTGVQLKTLFSGYQVRY